MDLWIAASMSAALFQTVRFMLQKVLSMGVLSTAGSTFARFVYAAPVVWTALLCALWLGARPFPALSVTFWVNAALGGLAQIMATACVVALFRQRNFAVGITFKKTEVILTAIVGLLFFNEIVSLIGWIAILIGLAGVLLLSRTPGLEKGLWASLTSRATGLGLAAGLLFAVSATTYRAASLEIASDDPWLRAGVTLACVITLQCLSMMLWLRFREPGQMSAVWQARKVAVWIGLTSLAGSFCWFLAFTLQTAAYVKAVGQIELIFSIMATVLFFKEKITLRELIAVGCLAVSILVFVLAV